MNETGKERTTFNTTINKEVLDSFREYCKDINCPMNLALEIFMKQFIEGQFSLSITKNKMTMDLNEPRKSRKTQKE